MAFDEVTHKEHEHFDAGTASNVVKLLVASSAQYLILLLALAFVATVDNLKAKIYAYGPRWWGIGVTLVMFGHILLWVLPTATLYGLLADGKAAIDSNGSTHYVAALIFVELAVFHAVPFSAAVSNRSFPAAVTFLVFYVITQIVAHVMVAASAGFGLPFFTLSVFALITVALSGAICWLTWKASHMSASEVQEEISGYEAIQEQEMQPYVQAPTSSKGGMKSTAARKTGKGVV